MANVFRTRPRSYTGGTAWDPDNDAAIFSIVTDLLSCGWIGKYRYHYFKLVTNADMNHFSGTGSLHFNEVIPGADCGYTGPIPLIMDAVPSGYVPPPTHFIFQVTGTTAKATSHQAVVDALVFIAGKNDCGEHKLVPIGTDMSDPEPNTLLMFQQFCSDADIVAPLDRSKQIISEAAVGLHTSHSGLANGGYALTCVPNGDGGNRTSVFFHRNDVAGIDPFQPAFLFAEHIAGQPVLTNMHAFSDRSAQVTIDFTRADLLIAAGPHHLMLAQTSGGQNGHVEVAALDLPITDGPDVLRATFSIAGSTGGASVSFRGALTANGATGGCYLAINNDTSYDFTAIVQQPTLMNLWGFDAIGKWQGNLSQILEPWVSYSTDPLKKAEVLGKLPDAIVVDGSFDANLTPARKWDGNLYNAYTHNGLNGTIFFKADEAEGFGDCIP